MAELNHLPNDHSVVQVGLWSDSWAETETLIQRVTRFNHNRATNITLDIEEHESGDQSIPNGPTGRHMKFRLTFPSHEVQEAFWLE